MYVFIAILLCSFYGLYLGRKKSANLVTNKISQLHSTPIYHGYYIFLWCFFPSLIVFISWQVLDNYLIKSLVLNLVPGFETLDKANLNFIFEKIKIMSTHKTIDPFFYDEQLIPATKKYNWLTKVSDIALFTVILSFLAIILVYLRNKIQMGFKARVKVEKFIKSILFACSVVAIFTTLGIVLSLLLESLKFFQSVPLFDFIFGTHWSPQIAIREDQVGSSGAFGSVPVLAGTLLITLIAMIVSIPVGLFSAIFLSDYAPTKIRSIAKPLLEILAGIPTVVYGFFAALTVGPFLRRFGESIGLNVVSESALAAGLVMGIMIIPFISSLSDDIINAVPQELKDGSYAMGATKSETMVHVTLPAALPGIVGSILLAVSRAIGETMIVVMAAGMSARLTANPFEAVTTVTVQIVTLLVGDQEFDNPKTLAAFALGLQLFLLTLFLNLFALKIVQKYREKYE